MKKAGECCKVVECDSGTFVSSTTNLNSLANGGGIYIKNPNGGSQFVTPTMPSGGTPAPGSGGTGNKAPTLSMCSRSLFKIKAFNFLHFGPFKVSSLSKLCIILLQQNMLIFLNSHNPRTWKVFFCVWYVFVIECNTLYNMFLCITKLLNRN